MIFETVKLEQTVYTLALFNAGSTPSDRPGLTVSTTIDKCIKACAPPPHRSDGDRQTVSLHGKINILEFCFLILLLLFAKLYMVLTEV